LLHGLALEDFIYMKKNCLMKRNKNDKTVKNYGNI
jgi:hypothetical protein